MQDFLFECRVSLFECRISLFECRISLFDSRIALLEIKDFPFLRTGFACPQRFQDFGRYPLKWFLVITCTIWLRLEFRGRASAWFFSPHLLFFHAWGQIFEPGIGFWIPRSTFWTGDLFGSKLSPQKSEFATETCCHGGSRDFP